MSPPLMAWSETMEIPCMAHLPPLRVTQRIYTHKDCGTEFRPGEVGVHRWEIGGEVLWVSTCPGCRSTVAVHKEGSDED